MPLTQIPIPVLAHFLCIVENMTGLPAQPLDATPEQRAQAQDGNPLPKGVVLGPDGKPYVLTY